MVTSSPNGILFISEYEGPTTTRPRVSLRHIMSNERQQTRKSTAHSETDSPGRVGPGSTHLGELQKRTHLCVRGRDNVYTWEQVVVGSCWLHRCVQFVQLHGAVCSSFSTDMRLQKLKNKGKVSGTICFAFLPSSGGGPCFGAPALVAVKLLPISSSGSALTSCVSLGRLLYLLTCFSISNRWRLDPIQGQHILA